MADPNVFTWSNGGQIWDGTGNFRKVAPIVSCLGELNNTTTIFDRFLYPTMSTPNTQPQNILDANSFNIDAVMIYDPRNPQLATAASNLVVNQALNWAATTEYMGCAAIMPLPIGLKSGSRYVIDNPFAQLTLPAVNSNGLTGSTGKLFQIELWAPTAGQDGFGISKMTRYPIGSYSSSSLGSATAQTLNIGNTWGATLGPSIGHTAQVIGDTTQQYMVFPSVQFTAPAALTNPYLALSVSYNGTKAGAAGSAAATAAKIAQSPAWIWAEFAV